MSGMGGLALWVILKGMTAKPIETGWTTAIVSPILGCLYLYWGREFDDPIDVGFIVAGCHSLLLFVASVIDLYVKHCDRKQRELDAQRDEEEEARRTAERRARRVQSRAEERQARATELANALAAHQPTYTAIPVAAYAVSEESPVAASAMNAPTIAPATDEEEERDENENNSPTPPAAKPLAGKRICVTGKLPYKRRRVEDFIVALGGTISGSVTRNTDFLIYDSKYDNHIYESTKYAKACELGVLILSWKSFMATCGFPEDYDIFESESCGFWNAREQRIESVEIKRAYGKEYERMSGLLKKILCGDFLGRVSCEIRKDLIKPISVVVKCDDADQEDIEVLRVCRYEVSPSTNPRFDGDFLFFDKNGNECDFKSLTVDSVARLLAAYGR